MEQPFKEEHGDQIEFNIIEYLDLIRKHIGLIIVSGIVGILAALVLAYLKAPLYKAQAKLKLDLLHDDALQTDNIPAYSRLFYREEITKTEFQIIQSLPVINRVVDTLGLAYFDEHFPEKASRFQTLMTRFRGNENEPPPTPEEIEEGKRKRARTILLRGLNLVEMRDTYIVQFGFISGSPAVSQKIANTWVVAYIDHGLEEKYLSNKQALDFIASRLLLINKETAELIAKKTDLEKALNVVTLGKDSSVEDQGVSKLNQSLIQAENDGPIALAEDHVLGAGRFDRGQQGAAGGESVPAVVGGTRRVSDQRQGLPAHQFPPAEIGCVDPVVGSGVEKGASGGL